MTSSERFEENVEVDVAEARTVDEKRDLAAARKAEVLSRKSMIPAKIVNTSATRRYIKRKQAGATVGKSLSTSRWLL